MGPLCTVCGVKQRLPYSHSYCRDCRNAHSRAHRPRYADLPETERAKSRARAYANVLERRGDLVRKPCERCGGTALKHIPALDNPRTVIWLCGACRKASALT